MPIWTAEQEVHVLELLGRHAWLNSSPEDEQSACHCMAHSAANGFLWMVQNFRLHLQYQH